MPANQGAGDSTSTEQTNAGDKQQRSQWLVWSPTTQAFNGLEVWTVAEEDDASTTTGIAGGQDNVGAGWRAQSRR